MKDSILRLRALEKQLYAYRYALNAIDFDAETVAPEGGAEGRAEACEVLSRASFDLLVNPRLRRPAASRGRRRGGRAAGRRSAGAAAPI